MQTNTDTKAFGDFVLLTALFNVFLLSKELIIVLHHLAGDHVSHWLYAQYFMSYTEEFVKRGLVGAVFQAAGVAPDTWSILKLSLVASNLFFVLFYLFARIQMGHRAQRAFLPFMLLFIVSPAAAMHLGLDAGRFDHLNLVLTVAALIALVQGGRTAYLFVPLALAAGMLIHEAFLFINAPLILAVTYNEIQKGRHPMGLLRAEAVALAVPLLCILLWGGASPGTLQRAAAQAGAVWPGYDHAYPLTVWTYTLRDNVAMVMARYGEMRIQVHLLVALPFLAANYLLYRSLLAPSRLESSLKLVFLAPVVMLPLFALGYDFFRWIALCVTMMFMSFAYLAREVDIDVLKAVSLRNRVLLLCIGLYTFLGPLGVHFPSFPFVWRV